MSGPYGTNRYRVKGNVVPRPSKSSLSAPVALDALSARQRAIVHAAFAVLMERGYAGASTLEIATRARVSKRELYAEFGSKSGILQALIAATASHMQIPLTAAELGDRHGLAAALTRYGIAALGALTSPAVVAMNRLAVAEAGRSSELGRILEASGREPNRKALIGLLAEAQAKGLLGDGDPDTMGGQFFSLLLGDLMLRLLLGVVRPPGPKEIERRAEAATSALLALHAP